MFPFTNILLILLHCLVSIEASLGSSQIFLRLLIFTGKESSKCFLGFPPYQSFVKISVVLKCLIFAFRLAHQALQFLHKFKSFLFFNTLFFSLFTNIEKNIGTSFN